MNNLRFEVYVLRRVGKKLYKLFDHAVHGRFYAVLTNRRLTGMPISKLNSWNTYWLLMSCINYYFTVRQSCKKKLERKNDA